MRQGKIEENWRGRKKKNTRNQRRVKTTPH